MYQDPDTPPASVVVVVQGAPELWVKALQRPEADLRCQAAEAIARAHRSGVKNLDTTIAPLVAALERPDPHPSAQLAVADALITLDARSAAPALFRQSQVGSSELRALVEPALARWDYRPVRSAWLARLRDPAARPQELLLAIRGLGAVREEQAVAPLRALVFPDVEGGKQEAQPGSPGPYSSRLPPFVGLEAARVLGTLRTEGLEQETERLATEARSLSDRLAAAALLHRHRSEASIRILQGLARDNEPAVAARALAPLLEIDPKPLVPAVGSLLASPDATLRSLAVKILFREPSPAHIRLMADQLDDPHPEVRLKVRRSLEQLAARNEFREPVLREGMRVLAGQHWRGLEQATILLTNLDHKPAAGRLVELLSFDQPAPPLRAGTTVGVLATPLGPTPLSAVCAAVRRTDRPEVFVTAAWGLRRLAVPESLPEVLSYVQAHQQYLLVHRHVYLDHQVSQLNQLLGRLKYARAEAVLRRFVPRTDGWRNVELRAAAIWALGLIREGKPDTALATALVERIDDNKLFPPGPEDIRVRRMAAITLGRMRARDKLADLRRYRPVQEKTQSTIGNACGWSIAQITGETMRPARTTQKVRHEGFLLPLK
jgi:HEAT repeat protein